MADESRHFFGVAVFERQQHKATLKLLSGIAERLRVRGANGMWAPRACLLCQRQTTARQAECLHMTAREHLEAQQKRLERPLRLQEPIPASYADQTGAK